MRHTFDLYIIKKAIAFAIAFLFNISEFTPFFSTSCHPGRSRVCRRSSDP